MLDAATLTAKILWTVGVPGGTLELEGVLAAVDLPELDVGQPGAYAGCNALCAMLRERLGPDGEVTLSGKVVTDDEAVSVTITGTVGGAVIPVERLDAQLEDLALVLELTVPKAGGGDRRGRGVDGPARREVEGDRRRLAPRPTARAVRSSDPCDEAPGKQLLCGAVDVLFLLDESASIEGQSVCPPSIRPCWNLIKKFVSEVTGRFNVGQGDDQTRVGVVSFSSGYPAARCGAQPVSPFLPSRAPPDQIPHPLQGAIAAERVRRRRVRATED